MPEYSRWSKQTVDQKVFMLHNYIAAVDTLLEATRLLLRNGYHVDWWAAFDTITPAYQKACALMARERTQQQTNSDVKLSKLIQLDPLKARHDDSDKKDE